MTKPVQTEAQTQNVVIDNIHDVVKYLHTKNNEDSSAKFETKKEDETYHIYADEDGDINVDIIDSDGDAMFHESLSICELKECYYPGPFTLVYNDLVSKAEEDNNSTEE